MSSKSHKSSALLTLAGLLAACGPGKSVGAADAGGGQSACVGGFRVLAPQPPNPTAQPFTAFALHLAVDDTSVYWLQPSRGAYPDTLNRIAKDGSGAAALSLIAYAPNLQSQIAVDAGGIYLSSTASIVRIDKLTNAVSSRGGSGRLLVLDDTTLFIGGPGIEFTTKAQFRSPGYLLRDANAVSSSVMRIDATNIYADDGRGALITLAKVGANQVAKVLLPTGTVTGLVLDDTSIYWLVAETGRVMKANKDGTNPTVLYTQPRSSGPIGLARVGGTLYFGPGKQSTGIGLESVNIDGTGHATHPWAGNTAVDVAGDGTSVYFIDDSGAVIAGCDAGPTTNTVPGAGPPSSIGNPGAGGVTNGVIYVDTAHSGTPERIGTDGVSVFIQSETSTLLRVRVDGGPVEALMGQNVSPSDPSDFSNFVVDSNGLYFGAGSAIWRWDPISKKASVLLSQQPYHSALSLTATDLFYLGTEVKSLKRTPGALPSTLYAANASVLAVDGQGVYYNDRTKVYQGSLSGGGTPIFLGDSLYSLQAGNVTIPVGGLVKGIAPTATDVWYTVQSTSNGASLVVKAPKGGGSTPQIVVGSLGGNGQAGSLIASLIMADSKHVYWLADGGSIYRLPLAAGPGATPEAFATGQRLDWFAMDETSVYYSDLADATVSRKPK